MNEPREMKSTKISNSMLREVAGRLRDYDAHDFIEERRKLVEAWRSAHPEAANEDASALSYPPNSVVGALQGPAWWTGKATGNSRRRPRRQRATVEANLSRTARCFHFEKKKMKNDNDMADTRESVWFEESVIDGKFEGWWAQPPKGIGGWLTQDPDQAKRYSKSEAEAVAAALSYFPTPFRWSNWVATEHIFMGDRSRPDRPV